MRLFLLIAPALLLACSTNPVDVEDDVGGAGGTGGSGAAGGTGGSDVPCTDDTNDPDEVVSMTAADPLAGVFTLEDALVDLPPGDGPLRAVITTDAGEITCTFDERAENAVANFIGLARGIRPWVDTVESAWVKRRFYDGLLYHRIIDDFMAQGGDPLGTGFGGPGYQIADEIFPDLLFTPGTLSYANSGPNTNGSQYFITEVATSHLDGDFTILGRCEPMSVIEALTATETDANDRPLTDTFMQRIDITRCPL